MTWGSQYRAVDWNICRFSKVLHIQQLYRRTDTLTCTHAQFWASDQWWRVRLIYTYTYTYTLIHGHGIYIYIYICVRIIFIDVRMHAHIHIWMLLGDMIYACYNAASRLLWTGKVWRKLQHPKHACRSWGSPVMGSGWGAGSPRVLGKGGLSQPRSVCA